ncbi:MAG: response regulator [Pseudobdellovibrio sp.]
MGYKVLIIEDDLTYKPLWTEMLNNNIENAPVQIHWAVSAEEANVQFVDSIKTRNPFDMIITDVFLAGSETGLDFVEGLNRHNIIAPPVILVSSADQQDVEEFCSSDKLCKVEVLSKPINPKEFKKILKKII